MATQIKTRIKICGVMDTSTAKFVAEQGVDAIGLVFVGKSPRSVSIEQARTIAAATPPYVSVVGLFMNASIDDVNAVLSAVPLDMLQFHGEETAAFCNQFGRPYVKAIPMNKAVSGEVNNTDAKHSGITNQAEDGNDAWLNYSTEFFQASNETADASMVRGYLLDSHSPGSSGGSGKTFDWNAIEQQRRANAEVADRLQSVVLAGGLHAGNVADAIKTVQPWAVDVSSGVESAPGVKDKEKITAFVQAVNSV